MTTEERKHYESVQGFIHSWESFGTVDGPGVRVVFFLQGCPLRCLYCHNPDAVSTQGGEVWTAGQLVATCKRYRNFMRGGGVTLSGGEPLLQAEFCEAVIRLLHEEGVHVTIDTSGCIPLEKAKTAINLADLLLLDIKALDPETSEKLTCNNGKNAWALLQYCEAANKPVWIRHVLLRGYTLEDETLNNLANRLKAYRCVQKVELLPFHKLGEHKWENLGRPYTLADVPATTGSEAERARDIFRARGLSVQ